MVRKGKMMNRAVYRYTFHAGVALEDVEAVLVLALFAVESLYGEPQVRLDVEHFLDADKRACVIDAGTRVGRDFNRIFLGFMQREYPPEAVRVERLITKTTGVNSQAVA
jgi:hypothetical protein